MRKKDFTNDKRNNPNFALFQVLYQTIEYFTNQNLDFNEKVRFVLYCILYFF